MVLMVPGPGRRRRSPVTFVTLTKKSVAFEDRVAAGGDVELIRGLRRRDRLRRGD
jgi:hypothetical protein